MLDLQVPEDCPWISWRDLWSHQSTPQRAVQSIPCSPHPNLGLCRDEDESNIWRPGNIAKMSIHTVASGGHMVGNIWVLNLSSFQSPHSQLPPSFLWSEPGLTPRLSPLFFVKWARPHSRPLFVEGSVLIEEWKMGEAWEKMLWQHGIVGKFYHRYSPTFFSSELHHKLLAPVRAAKVSCGIHCLQWYRVSNQ